MKPTSITFDLIGFIWPCAVLFFWWSGDISGILAVLLILGKCKLEFSKKL